MAQQGNDAYREILQLLKERTPTIPLLDPTANVLKLVEVEKEHGREIRRLEERHEDQVSELRKQLSEAITERLDAKAETEKVRVDARLAEVVAAAALAKVEVTTQTSGFNVRMAAVEQRQYTGGGKSAGLNAGWGYLIGAVALASAIAAIWLKGH